MKKISSRLARNTRGQLKTKNDSASPPTRVFSVKLLAALVVAGVIAGASLSHFFPVEFPGGSLSGQVIDIGANNQRFAEVDNGLPFEEIHWKIRVRLYAAGSAIPIPAGIGSTLGKNIDNEVSGTNSAPMRTEKADGVIYIDNTAPRLNEDKLMLGYFFNRVWGEKFSGVCILEYCNGPGGVVKMWANGKPNQRFEDYEARDGDDIVIAYELP